MSGDKTLLIWLGKQYLGQAERQFIDQRTVNANLNASAEVESSQLQELLADFKAILHTKVSERKA